MPPFIPTAEGWYSIFPLVHINPPHVIWENQPTLVLAECFFLFLFLCITHHAFFSGGAQLDVRSRRKRIALWSASIVGGACIELCTVLKKDIGNFYHSQAVIMLFGRREPLYMLMGCYGYFNYIGCAFVWETTTTTVYMVQCQEIPTPESTREEHDKDQQQDTPEPSSNTATTQLVLLQEEKQTYANHVGGAWSESLVAGLIGSLGWGLLDTVGLKLLWWTWHNDEPLYKDRREGVPIASSFWIFSSIASLNWILHYWYGRPVDVFVNKNQTTSTVTTTTTPMTPHVKEPSVNTCQNIFMGCVLGPVATLGLMHVPFVLLYHPLVMGFGHSATLPFAMLRACAWSGLVAALYSSVMEADEVPNRLALMLKGRDVVHVERGSDEDEDVDEDEDDVFNSSMERTSEDDASTDVSSDTDDEATGEKDTGASDQEEVQGEIQKEVQEEIQEEVQEEIQEEVQEKNTLTKELLAFDMEDDDGSNVNGDASGTSGASGASGASGESGDSGESGNSGESGESDGGESNGRGSDVDSEEYDYDEDASQRRSLSHTDAGGDGDDFSPALSLQRRRQKHRRQTQENVLRTPTWSINAIVSSKYHWPLFLYVILSGLFSMYVLLHFLPEHSVRMSYGQPYTAYDKNCTNDIE
jgi:uncharacterized membrane protein YgcG